MENGAYFDLFGGYERDDQSAGARRLTSTDRFFKEKLTLFSNGYFYHPRLLTYYVSLTEALKQETYEATFVPPLGRRDSSSFEYDARVFLLPEHPYHLELFATRYEPLFREVFAIQHDTISTSRGADFRYRRKPWFFHVRVSDDRIDAAESSSDVRKLALSARYFKELAGGKKLSFDATFSPSRFRNSGGVEGNTTDASLGNTFETGLLRAFSSLTWSELTQKGGFAVSAKTSQLSWLEQVSADLPHNLRADLSYRYQDSDSEFGGPTDPAASTLTSIRRSLELDLKHQLYQSLQTLYRFRDDSGSSAGGSTTSLDHSLTFIYTKRIPEGQFLASVYGGQGETKSAGQTQIVDELHSDAAVPGTFLLERPAVDSGSVVVFVRSRLAPFELVRLEEHLNYTVAIVGNSLEITVLSLPADFVVPGKYDFRVSYALVGGDFRLRTRTYGENLSVALFDSLLTPYFSYSAVRSSVLSGFAPGGGTDSDVLTAGVLAYKGPVRARVEYQDVRWEVSPYREWKGEVQLVGALTRTTYGNATAAYQDRRLTQTLADGTRSRFAERVSSGYANIQQTLFSRSLSVSAGGGYTRIQGLNESRSWSLGGTLSWRIGKLDVSGGASYTGSDAQENTLFAARRIHEYYYLKLRRQIF